MCYAMALLIIETKKTPLKTRFAYIRWLFLLLTKDKDGEYIAFSWENQGFLQLGGVFG